jgi:hypothetical protein
VRCLRIKIVNQQAREVRKVLVNIWDPRPRVFPRKLCISKTGQMRIKRNYI